MTIDIISFGYLHGMPPTAHVTLDLRDHFRDPHVTPELRHLTAHDGQIREAVRATPGIMPLVAAAATLTGAYLSGPNTAAEPLRIAVGCAGGRHRAPSVALEIQGLLARMGVKAPVVHRDLAKDVVGR